MQPGGKLESGEGAVAASERELEEEVGCRLQQTRFLGVFRAPAANELGHHVEAMLFAAEVSGVASPGQEIAEVIWVDLRSCSSLSLAPLTQKFVLPLASAFPFSDQ